MCEDYRQWETSPNSSACYQCCWWCFATNGDLQRKTPTQGHFTTWLHCQSATEGMGRRGNDARVGASVLSSLHTASALHAGDGQFPGPSHWQGEGDQEGSSNTDHYPRWLHISPAAPWCEREQAIQEHHQRQVDTVHAWGGPESERWQHPKD